MSRSTKRLNILVSYAYINTKMYNDLTGMGDRCRWILDSGAFTVWKKGKSIDIKEYCAYIKSLPVKPWRYFNLDVIGDPEKTLKNYEFMLSEGLSPIPIFTRGEKWEMIDHYYKTSEVVALGGLVGTKNNKNALKQAMQYIGKRKVHWLGFTAMDYIKHYKPYMCDSSSCNVAARYGSIHLYLGNGKSKIVTRKDFMQRPPDYIIKAVQSLGFNPADFAKASTWKNEPLHEIGKACSIKMSLDVKQHLGTNLFLALANKKEISQAITQFNKITKWRGK